MMDDVVGFFCGLIRCVHCITHTREIILGIFATLFEHLMLIAKF